MQSAYFEYEIAKVPNLNIRRPFPIESVRLPMDRTGEVVYLIEEDSPGRAALLQMLVAFELKVVCFGAAAEYFAYTRSDTSACLVLEMKLPDIHGLELQRQLAGKMNPPIIFVSAECDIPTTVCAMKAGALEFLTKPVDPKALVAAIRTAFAQDRRLRQRRADVKMLEARFSLLTPREREVLPLVVGGLLNKQAAAFLGISEVTLAVHRGQVMRKMAADSLAELVRMAVRLRIPHWSEPNGA
jgi:FixJ family two-component response regulator